MATPMAKHPSMMKSNCHPAYPPAPACLSIAKPNKPVSADADPEPRKKAVLRAASFSRL
jgi:hypothetical protein